MFQSKSLKKNLVGWKKVRIFATALKEKKQGNLPQ